MSGIRPADGALLPQYNPQTYGPPVPEQGEQAAEGAQPLPSPGGSKEIRSLHEMLKEAREKAEAQRERFKLPKNASQYGDASMQAYSRLARARTQAEVNAAAGYARRQIVRFKAAKRQDSDNAERIQAAINQLQKAVTRANKKKRDLSREELLKARRAKKEQANQRREAQRIQLELNRRKTMRMIRESGYIREAEIDNRLQAQLAQTRMELRAQAEALGASTAPATSPDTAAQQYAAQAAPPPAPEAGVDLQA